MVTILINLISPEEALLRETEEKKAMLFNEICRHLDHKYQINKGAVSKVLKYFTEDGDKQIDGGIEEGEKEKTCIYWGVGHFKGWEESFVVYKKGENEKH